MKTGDLRLPVRSALKRVGFGACSGFILLLQEPGEERRNP